MKNYIIGILVLFTLTFLFGCESEQVAEKVNSKEETKQEEKKQEEAPFFWKVTEEENTVYLLGSIHVGNEDMYPLDQVVEEAYDISDYLVVEANITDISEEMFNPELISQMMYMDGSLLSEHISETSYEKLSELISQHNLEGLSMTELNHMKPWMIKMLLSELLLSEEETIQSEFGIDLHFLERATADNKSILELEGVDEQLSFYSKMPDELQIQALEETLVALEEEPNDAAVKQIIEAWKTGSEEQLAPLVSIDEGGTISDYQAYEVDLMEKRNIQMVEKIKGYLTDGTGQTYFVVVGAAHFLDEIGLDNLLSKDFTVKSYEEMN
ncbi:TraB/GumN family protein [Bacillus sp. BGMRC 2118]|nr:TraB/GumN family protein [Bacillus sp. BGMRC 2118]